MLSHKLDFSSCAWKPGFVKSSHILSAWLNLFIQQTFPLSHNYIIITTAIMWYPVYAWHLKLRKLMGSYVAICACIKQAQILLELFAPLIRRIYTLLVTDLARRSYVYI